MRWPSVDPPRLAVATSLDCPVVNGDLCAPGTTVPGVPLVATDQPTAQPVLIQWRATFHLTGVTTQPAAVIFNVPTGGEVDLALVVSIPPEPPAIVMVSVETAAQAAQSALDAELAAVAADADRIAAEAAATAANSSRPQQQFGIRRRHPRHRWPRQSGAGASATALVPAVPGRTVILRTATRCAPLAPPQTIQANLVNNPNVGATAAAARTRASTGPGHGSRSLVRADDVWPNSPVHPRGNGTPRHCVSAAVGLYAHYCFKLLAHTSTCQHEGRSGYSLWRAGCRHHQPGGARRGGSSGCHCPALC